MGITKRAKNIEIKVIENYQLIVRGRLEKNASKLNFEATKGDLNLISGKKIIAHGKEKQ
ncbi:MULTISPECIES: hypothetical protein [Flavobacterium]|uniref:hypothetical protein n=1 Tax=Flavobacterium TaxID=237 RepID=UPI001642641E|nr:MULTISPECIES: hypothetical protein [Flavobacterium]MCR4030196.1 hypothetical protein [Flavobacterium panacis]